MGAVWPPAGVITFRAFGVPLLNSIILLASGASVTWAHHGLLVANHRATIQGLALTVLLGGYFSSLQAYEYLAARFTLREGAYGSAFYIATGFHGVHVIVGALFLSVGLYRLILGHFSHNHHFGLEAAAWY